MNYITRVGGATVTIFVPYTCQNNCPFCINKAEYSKTKDFSITEILKSIRIMHALTPKCDFVLTGGEPLANLEYLQMILDEIPLSHKVFINTTFPVNLKYSLDEVVDLINTNYHNGRITGINVSRHFHPFVQECSDEIFEKLDLQVRINCVLFGSFSGDILKKFVDRFSKYTTYIQFRKDYTETTLDNLYDEKDDKNLQWLKNTFQYKGSTGAYRMRCGYEFDYNGFKITYHKTLPYSRIQLNKNNTVLYDIIIKQNGEVRSDWDQYSGEINSKGQRVCSQIAPKLDLERYKEVVFEDYN